VRLQGYTRTSFTAAVQDMFLEGLASALLISPVSLSIVTVSAAPPAPGLGRRALHQAGVPFASPPPPTGGSVTVTVMIYQPGPGGLSAVEIVNRLSTLTPLTLAVALQQAGLVALEGVSTTKPVFTIPWPAPPAPPAPPPSPPRGLAEVEKKLEKDITALLAGGVGGAVGGALVLGLVLAAVCVIQRRKRARKRADDAMEDLPAPYKIDTPMWTAADLPLISKPTAGGAHSRHNWDSAGEDGSAHELATRLLAILPPLPPKPLPRTFNPDELPDTREASSAALAAIFAPPGATPDERRMPYMNTWAGERVAAAAILVDEEKPLLPMPPPRQPRDGAAQEREHRRHHRRHRSRDAPEGELRHRHRSRSRREEAGVVDGARPRRTPFADGGDPAAIPTRSGEVRTRSRSRSTPRHAADAALEGGEGRPRRAGSPGRERSHRHHRSRGDAALDRL
jgi:hypothetical protein